MGALAITNDDQKWKMLLHLAGPKTFKEFETLESSGTTYDDARTKLNEHFKPKVILDYEVSFFRSMRQKKNETLDQYLDRLCEQISKREFSQINKELKSHIITTTTDTTLCQERLARHFEYLRLSDGRRPQQ